MLRQYLRPVFLISFTFPLLSAQSSAPQTYSLTAVSRISYEAMAANQAAEIKVYRSGSRELVEETTGPRAGKPKGVVMRRLFDLGARKVYSLDAVNNSCSWMKYVSAEMPAAYDPIAAAPKSPGDIAEFNKHVVRKESINGISSKVAEFSGDEGKSTVWIAEKGDFPVKASVAGPDGQSMVLQEVKSVSFEKPAESLFAPPQNCATQVQGEWSATGISAHAETSIEAQGSGSADLKTNQVQGDVSVKQGKKP
jgi:hypothetical protein